MRVYVCCIGRYVDSRMVRALETTNGRRYRYSVSNDLPYWSVGTYVKYVLENDQRVSKGSPCEPYYGLSYSRRNMARFVSLEIMPIEYFSDPRRKGRIRLLGQLLVDVWPRW